MQRRRLWLWLTYATFVAGFLGIVLFVGGVTAAYFAERDGVDTAPFALLALGGLGFAALLFLGAFTLIGFLIARQTRSRGSGYGDAYRLIESFRFKDAIPLLERSIREGKETSEVLMLLTSAYAYSGQLAKAQASADRAVERFPDDPTAYVTLANGYRLQAAYAAAAETLMQALRLDPDQPVVWAELGFTQRYAGDHDAAIQSFERAAAHAMPVSYAVRVHYHLMQAYLHEGDARKAARAAAKMMSARRGLATWSGGLLAMEGTAYGQVLRFEIAAIEQALADADAGNLG